MFSKKQTRRSRALVIGTLMAGVMSIGAVADTAAAAEAVDDEPKVEQVDVRIGFDPGPMSMRSGIRW